jgi:glycosyltransferase involved in cell wall biosynthesis
MNVLFLMFAFPDMNKSFNMYTTLVEEFSKGGHQVVVLAPGSENTGVRQEKGIDVLRVKTLPIKNVSAYRKGIANILIPYQFENALRRHYPGKVFDLIIAPTPPITLVDLAAKLKRKFGARFYLILRDIFPQNAVDLGFMRKDGFIHRFFRRKEIRLYREADAIGCMSKGNIDYVLRHNPGLDAGKLHIMLNFQKPYSGFGSDRQALLVKYGLEGRFVVVFGGNMGKPQQLENVLQLAHSCRKYPDVLFLLLGEGVQMDRIAALVRENGYENIRIQRTVPKQEYQDLLSACHVGLISLHCAFTIPNIPSKALDYFNLGLPVLASLDSATDFGSMLDSEQSGLWSLAGDHASLFGNFERMYASPELRIKMGQNGKRYFDTNLTPDLAYRTILEHAAQHTNA